MTMRLASVLSLLVAAAGLSIGCGSPTEAPVAGSLTGLTGQSLVAGTSVTATLRVLSTTGAPMQGQAFTATSSSPGIVTVTVTDSTATLHAVGPVGTAQLTASAGSVQAIATVTVIPGPAATVTKLRGDNQSVAVGLPFADSLAVKVTDAYANPLAQSTVTWAVTAGGGTISTASSTTDASGVVTAGWTAGCTTGANSATATVATLPAATFSGTATAGAARALTLVSGNTEADTIQAALGDSVVVRVADACSGGVAGTVVNWTLSGGRGSLRSTTTTSSAAGLGVNRWTLGGVTGTDTLTASSTGLASVTFTATVNPGVATTVTAISGNAQSDTIGAVLHDSLVVKVADRLNNGVTGRAVSWTTTGGRGSVAPTSSTTNAAGLARTRWTVGNAVGTDTVTTSTAGLTSRVFTATVRAGNLAVLAADSGNGNIVGAGRPDTLVARATDRVGNPIAGQTVTWTVLTGGGSVAPGSGTTEATGRARAVWTVGIAVGAGNSAQAAIGTVTRTFTATVVAGPATRLTVDSAFVVQDSGTSRTRSVAASDAYNNVIASPVVTWTSRTTTVVTVSSAGSVTCIGRGQSLVIAASGTASDSTLIVCAVPTGVVVRTGVPMTLRADTTLTVSIYVDMRNSGERLGSTTIDINWSPTLLAFQSYANGSWGSPVVNAANAAAGTLRMSLADATGQAGLVEVLRVTFRAGATTGVSGSLVLVVSEVSGAGTFTNLLPKTVAVTHPIGTR